MYYELMDSFLGTVVVAADETGIRHIEFQDGERPLPIEEGWQREETPVIAEAIEQLGAYFAGKRQSFDLPLNPKGTPFQQAVWGQLSRIPYGQVIHYGALADRLGKPTASRAVGAANGKNPIAVVIPCHRVIGKNGKLTGYAGGLTLKSELLDMEATAVG